MNTLYLIDGHALIFKMYYAFLRRPMINSKGMDTSILFGFTKYLLELLERRRPTHLAVAFDPPGGTFRNEMFPEYKGTRPPTPQPIIDALEPLTELLQAFRVPVLMERGFEADDVIGSMARRAEAAGFTVYMVTPDKDYGQLITPNVLQYKPGKGGGDDEVIGPAELSEKWGIASPAQMIDMLTLCGDTADNVPGVRGIGEVGAAKLIAKYGSVDGIYAHLSELTPRQQGQFEEARDHIALSRALVTIKTDIPLAVTDDEMRVPTACDPALADLFEKYEFNSLKRHIAHLSAAPVLSSDSSVLSSEVEKSPYGEYKELLAAEFIAAARSAGRVGIAVLQNGGFQGQTAGIAASVLEKGVFQGQLGEIRALLEDASIEKVGFDLKKTARMLAEEGIALAGRWVDIALMHYLINPERSHAADILVKSYLGVDLVEESVTQAEVEPDLFGESSVISSEGAAEVEKSMREAALLLPLAEKVAEELRASGMEKLYDEIEEPVAKVLAKMEVAGVKIEMAPLEAFADQLRAEIIEREARIREMAGVPDLNISSPKQVGDVLFDKLQLDPTAKKSARGQYSTDETTLQEIADRHPIVDEILEFRAAKKLLSTYIEPFPGYISPRDGRIHTTFNQALTATGRLSSSNPNLQNIPIRTERGRGIRAAFVPGTKDGLILSADYSQIELRIMAHLSGDEHLCTAFREGVDVHSTTAAKIFGVPVAEVTPDQRRRAKTTNFGIMYGISSFGLAQRLRIGRKEAKALIDDYFAGFPAIRGFIESCTVFVRENGYAETLFGRRRYIPDIHSHNATVRALAERNAVNAPIQGTAADIIKLAMVEVDRRMTEKGMRSRMVLQIHDELVFDVVPEEAEELKALVVDAMEHVIALSVPLTVECNLGKNWLEAH